MQVIEKSIRTFLGSQDLSLPISTAQGVGEVPFQRWFKFKEAFSPKFVSDVIEFSKIKVNSIFDPFGGSGTTSLTGQLLGIKPTTIEVNPFLADLIESKLTKYDVGLLISEWVRVIREVDKKMPDLASIYKDAPPTLYNSGITESWLFDKEVFFRIVQYRMAIDEIEDQNSKRLLKVLLGAILIPLSNVVISGKGRRYRKNWKSLNKKPQNVDELLKNRVNEAIFDISKYDNRKVFSFDLLRGDSRNLIEQVPESDLVLFSPPYPNTFDYTDIYNVELWVLGYLQTSNCNKLLRGSTLRSHVQVKREYARPPESDLLMTTIEQLENKKDDLWNKSIPQMVGAYFTDIETILRQSKRLLNDDGMVVIVIGDSRYVQVKINTAAITTEIANNLGLSLVRDEKIRVMKSSAQQGWAKDLDETALYFTQK